MKKLVLALACTSLLVACHSDGDSKPDAKKEARQTGSAIAPLLAGAWRSPENRARDQYRHPQQTLEFFGVTPSKTIIEIWPGGGWYSEILAPLLKDKGRYIAVVNDPAKMTTESRKAYYAKQNDALKVKFAYNAEAFGSPTLVEIDPVAPVLGAAESVDTVLTFRNVHNWVMADQQAAMFESFFEVLKPGGTLGVVEHRAKADADFEKIKTSGYLPEEYVINLALKAGFVLDARSEINANPKDTKDYPGGVWTLPPTLAEKEKDREKYLAIGESDRMTLRFKKPM